MTTPIIVVLVVTAVFTLVALGVLLWTVVRRTSAVVQDVVALQERLMPQLEALQRDADIASRELEQVGTSLEAFQRDRARRRDPGGSISPHGPDDR